MRVFNLFIYICICILILNPVCIFCIVTVFWQIAKKLMITSMANVVQGQKHLKFNSYIRFKIGPKSQNIKLLIVQAVLDPVMGRRVHHAVQGPKVSSGAGSRRDGETCTRCAAVDPSVPRHGNRFRLWQRISNGIKYLWNKSARLILWVGKNKNSVGIPLYLLRMLYFKSMGLRKVKSVLFLKKEILFARSHQRFDSIQRNTYLIW